MSLKSEKASLQRVRKQLLEVVARKEEHTTRGSPKGLKNLKIL
jgi:hypothetical protein